MNITSIRLLKLLTSKQREINKLPAILGIKDRQLSYIIKDLTKKST